MTKYFPVYAAILGVLALFLFLSPQIAKFISADTNSSKVKIQGGELPSPNLTAPSSLSPTAKLSTSAAPASTPKAKTDSPSLTINPGWNIVGSDKDLESKTFTGKDLTAFQMFAGSWHKAKPDSSKIVFNKQGAIYVYSSSEKSKTIDQIESKNQAIIKTGTGWNLLFNSSDQPLSFDNDFSLGGETVKLGDLIKNKKASKDVYVLKSQSNGVQIKKIDPRGESIPPLNGFWLYLFK